MREVYDYNVMGVLYDFYVSKLPELESDGGPMSRKMISAAADFLKEKFPEKFSGNYPNYNTLLLKVKVLINDYPSTFGSVKYIKRRKHLNSTINSSTISTNNTINSSTIPANNTTSDSAVFTFHTNSSTVTDVLNQSITRPSMSERERANFLHAAVSRAPGKRQIKPSAAIFDGEAGALDDDEDDEDFATSDIDSKNDDEASSEGSSEGNSDEEDEDDEENEVEIVKDEKKDVELVSQNSVSKQKNSLICTICLNIKAYTKNAEVIQCDRCGVAVHETCYAVDDVADTASNTSSASTDPWFCEPCLLGLNAVPHCELCPSRMGAFKKSNVPGSWVHLLCGLFTPGITFGDTDHLTAISWQEMDSRSFGRKACVACTNKLDARAGTTVQCEAGLCKNFYHVTCAQKLGLLIDNESEEHRHIMEDADQQHSSDFCFILCKRHNHSENLHAKKEAYAQFLRQEHLRMAQMNRTALTHRQENKRQQQYQGFVERMAEIEQFVTVTPSVKRPRVLHNSGRFLNLFAEKAELFGIEADHFASEFLTPPGEQIGPVPPAFSTVFIKYFENREKNVIPEEEERLEQIKTNRDKVNQQYKNLTELLKVTKDRALKVKVDSSSSVALFNRFCSALNALNVPKKNYLQKLTSPLPSPTRKGMKSTSLNTLKTPRNMRISLSTSVAKSKLSHSEKQYRPDSPNDAKGRMRMCGSPATILDVPTLSPQEYPTVNNGVATARLSDSSLVANRRKKSANATSVTSCAGRGRPVGTTKRKMNNTSPLSLPKHRRNHNAKFELPNDIFPSTSSALISRPKPHVEAVIPNISGASSPLKNTTIREQQQQNLSTLLGNISNSPVKEALAGAEGASTAVISSLKKSPSPVKRPNILARSSNVKTTSSATSISSVPTTGNDVSTATLSNMYSMTKLVAIRSPQFGSSGAPFGGVVTSPGPSGNGNTCHGIGISGSGALKKTFTSPATAKVVNGTVHSIDIPTDSSTMLMLAQSNEQNKEPIKCFTCKMASEPEIMVFCDTCKHHYHMGCLDPPLKKLPVKRKNFAFECSDCACPSTSEMNGKNLADSENS